jgi:homoserine dehydrogenase
MGVMRIGIAGLGTVGGGLLKLLSANQGRGPAMAVTAVSARNRGAPRAVDVSALPWFEDPVALAQTAPIDVFVELIGGAEGPAKRAVEAALDRGLHVVTANKALLAEHGLALAQRAEAKGVSIGFEAAAAGGAPAIKMLKEGLAGNAVQAVAGILNGTCNYLLTEMEASGRPFADVLAEAQRLGYAEADPTMDVGGFDAAHKIALLAALAFDAPPDMRAVEIEGVSDVTLLDIRLAGKLGYRIKLIAKAERGGGAVRARVAPVLLAMDHPLAKVDGALNAVVIDADPVGRLTLIGRGAGGGPTASAVAADLIDLAYGVRRPVFGLPADQLKALDAAAPSAEGRFYLRLLVKDRPGVIAAVADALARHGVSIESFLQDPAHDAAAVPIVLTTQRCARAALMAAIAQIAGLDVVAAPPRYLSIEDADASSKPWS